MMNLAGEKYLSYSKANMIESDSTIPVNARERPARQFTRHLFGGRSGGSDRSNLFIFGIKSRLLRCTESRTAGLRQKTVRNDNEFGFLSTFLISMFLVVTTISPAQIAGTPGAFSRMGFGARGMGMGNALTAVKTGENSGYYNPAVVALLKNQHSSVSYGLLSLDRSLNSIFYSQPIDTNAGIAFGILNAGVSDIDGRDVDGFKTETYSTSENQFSLSFALRIRKVTIGLTTKLYYYSLFEKLSTTTVGFDFGVMYPITPQLTIAGTFKDFNTKYRWETSDLYDQLGNSTIDKFPTRQTIGLSYVFEEFTTLLSAEIERSNKATTIIRAGGEISPIDALTLRAGIDGWDIKKPDQAHPSFGLTVRTDYTDWKPSVNYAYILEPYGLFSMHVISLSIRL